MDEPAAERRRASSPRRASDTLPTSDRRRSLYEGMDVESNDPENVLYICDHNNRQYLFPWRLAKEWLQVKSFLEQIYTRNHDGAHLEAVRNDQFDMLTEDEHVILPTVWKDVIPYPGSIVRVAFWSDTEPRGLRTRRVRTVQFDDDIGVDEWKGSESSPLRPLEQDGSVSSGTETDEEESAESTEPTESPQPPEPDRTPILPVDSDGNKLIFTVDTRRAGPRSIPPNDTGINHVDDRQTLKGSAMTTETLKIVKAATATAEGRTVLKVHALRGPESPSVASTVSFRWYHMYADRLDWTQFKSTCLDVPGLSKRLQNLISRTLHKIEREKLKQFLGGMFIEPGTVLRGDEVEQAEPESVIFSCVPFFELQNRPKTAHAQNGQLHPPRTLIESYYPDPPVSERDSEQAYRKFGNDHNDKLIHVPSMWVLNIGSTAVVTCAYQPLSTELVKSIELIQNDIKQLETETADDLVSIRLIDQRGCPLLYSLEECRTYFQMEQRLRELGSVTAFPGYEQSLSLVWHAPEGNKKVTPANWVGIAQKRNAFIIKLSVIDENQGRDLDDRITMLQGQTTAPQTSSIPPFFLWPVKALHSPVPEDFVSTETQRCDQCLRVVERRILKETIPEEEITGPVDGEFTSTKFYESLPEKTVRDVRNMILDIEKGSPTSRGSPGQTYHQTVFGIQCAELVQKAAGFFNIGHATMGLFLVDLDQSTMLRRLWGAMANVSLLIKQILDRGAYKSDPKEYSDEEWRAPLSRTRAWTIRHPANETQADPSLPSGGNDTMIASVRNCKSCKHGVKYQDPNEALAHLRSHFQSSSKTFLQQGSSSQSTRDEALLKDWIQNDDEILLETMNRGCLTLFNEAESAARRFFDELTELRDGVKTADGGLSDLYRFPRRLLETFRSLIMFYLAVERSLHFTLEHTLDISGRRHKDDLPYSKQGLQTLDRFSESVQVPLKQARTELCEMVRSPSSNFPRKRLSYGPEYICSWLMRRLLVRPLDQGMTVADMYREYLSALQFQVNHRPGKRLLRSINLLQEELMILSQVNDWQTRLIEDYTKVLDDSTYPIDIPARRALFPQERFLLGSCIGYLSMTRDEYRDQINRCGPLSEITKQSVEINEEDHGKAIFIFTVVTVIFLPLSFVTSFLGMNTSDIRDMDNTQTLFWEIAIPLTAVTLGSIPFIAYKGDNIRDRLGSVYRTLTGKRDSYPSGRGKFGQRRTTSLGPSNHRSQADEAEFATPQPDFYGDSDAIRGRSTLRRKSTFHKDAWYDNKDAWYDNKDAWYEGHRGPRYIHPTARPRPTPILPPDYAISPRGPDDAGRQTTRVHRDHIDPADLDDGYWPWKYDPADPHYIIVETELSAEERAQLFEATRRRKGRLSGDGTVGAYRWVNKARATRHRQRQREGDGRRERYVKEDDYV